MAYTLKNLNFLTNIALQWKHQDNFSLDFFHITYWSNKPNYLLVGNIGRDDPISCQCDDLNSVQKYQYDTQTTFFKQLSLFLQMFACNYCCHALDLHVYRYSNVCPHICPPCASQASNTKSTAGASILAT